MISKAQALYAKQRYGIALPTWLDAEDMPPGIPALARAVAAGLQRGWTMRHSVRTLIHNHQRDLMLAQDMVNGAREITEDLPRRRSLAAALKSLAEHEEWLGPLVLALHEATDEPHP